MERGFACKRGGKLMLDARGGGQEDKLFIISV
jgi:hypothetical protein